MLTYIVSAIVGYAFGSVPTAYLLVKWKTRVDIRRAGSGNVGTMNTFDVTGSKALSVGVLVIDMVKGALAVLIVMWLMRNDFEMLALAGLSAIAGHSFPVWLRFQGGRGLATTAGVMLVVGWIFIIIWIALWTGAYLSTRSVHAGNIIASLSSPLVVAIAPQELLAQTLPPYTSPTNLLFFSIVFCVIMLATHRQPLLSFLKRNYQS